MDAAISELWRKVLAKIEKSLSKPSFDTWLKATKANTLEEDALIVVAPNDFARDWLETRYSQLITDTLYEVTGVNMKVKFVV
ncbi:chromosomal replication initiator protein DnaA, partial [Brevibacillus invocatus]